MDLETKDGDRNGWSDVPVHHGTSKRTVQAGASGGGTLPPSAPSLQLTLLSALQSNPININGAVITERCSGTTRQHRWLVVEL